MTSTRRGERPVGIGTTELVIILILALIIFGPGKLPDVGKAIGKSFREFRRASSGEEDEANGSGGKSPKADSDESRESESSKE